MNDERKPAGISSGSASIIMIFAVLCMTIFSALSLVTAISEKSTADRYAASTSSYYEADCRAEATKAAIASALAAGKPAGEAAGAGETASSGLKTSSSKDADAGGAGDSNISGVSVKYTVESDGNVLFYYDVPMSDEESQLTVVLEADMADDRLEDIIVKCWKKSSTGEWAPDENIQVWDFTE